MGSLLYQTLQLKHSCAVAVKLPRVDEVRRHRSCSWLFFNALSIDSHITTQIRVWEGDEFSDMTGSIKYHSVLNTVSSTCWDSAEWSRHFKTLWMIQTLNDIEYISFYWPRSRILLLGSVGDLAPSVGLPESIALNFSSPMFVRLKAQSVVCLILSFPKIYEHFWGPKEKRWSFLQSHNSPRHFISGGSWVVGS